MARYAVNYYLGGDLLVTRNLETEEAKSTILEKAMREEEVSFEDEKGVLHYFSIKDIKLITVHESKKPMGIGL